MSSGMRLLIVTQAVDLEDPVLGFFHGWIEEVSKQCERVHVVCLKEGRHALPPNVFIHSLGKEHGRSVSKYLTRFYGHIFSLRDEYTAVFVHMNQEYVLLGGLLWRILGKRVVLWRNHKVGSFLTAIAARIAQHACFTSPSAYVARFANAVRMPIGIDTQIFRPGNTEPRSILFLGRLDPVKRVAVFIGALELLQKRGVRFLARLYGEPTEPDSAYAREIRERAAPLMSAGVLEMHTAVTNVEAARLFASHDVYVNLTPSGSFDKTIGEALAAGCIVVASNEAVRDILPSELFVADGSPEATACAIDAALCLGNDARGVLTERSRAYIEREHSLEHLVERLMPLFA